MPNTSIFRAENYVITPFIFGNLLNLLSTNLQPLGEAIYVHDYSTQLNACSIDVALHKAMTTIHKIVRRKSMFL